MDMKQIAIKANQAAIQLAAIETEVKNTIDEELRKAAQELLDEQRKAIRHMVEEHKLAIKEAVEEEKKAIWTRVEELRNSILKLGHR